MIKFLVDSSADFIPGEIAARELLCVPLGVTINGNDYLDGVDLSRDRFYELLTSASEFPKTTMPSPATFAEHFEQAEKDGDQVICIMLSSALSGTYQSAVTARDMVGYDGVYLVDTLMTAAGVRIMVDHAIRLRDEGASVADIVAALEALKGRIHVYAALDTLEYVYKGGRMSRAAAAVGTIANIKPLVTIDADGTIAMVKKSLSKSRARNDLMNILRQADIDPDFPTYTIYSSGTENIEYLEQQLADAGIKVSGRTQLGPAIGSHVGPGVYGIFLVEREN